MDSRSIVYCRWTSEVVCHCSFSWTVPACTRVSWHGPCTSVRVKYKKAAAEAVVSDPHRRRTFSKTTGQYSASEPAKRYAQIDQDGIHAPGMTILTVVIEETLSTLLQLLRLHFKDSCRKMKLLLIFFAVVAVTFAWPNSANERHPLPYLYITTQCTIVFQWGSKPGHICQTETSQSAPTSQRVPIFQTQCFQIWSDISHAREQQPFSFFYQLWRYSRE